jgi:hypothetical protein
MFDHTEIREEPKKQLLLRLIGSAEVLGEQQSNISFNNGDVVQEAATVFASTRVKMLGSDVVFACVVWHSDA